MTELEKAANEYRLSAYMNPERYCEFGSNIMNAFVAGAEWQKEQLIEKACEWLNDCAYFYVNDYTGSLDEKALVKDFRKTVEE